MFADARFWDGIAEDYAAKPVQDTAAFERKIAVTKSLLHPESEVLEFGCGTGSLALILAPFAKQIHGLDISGEMIRIARQKAHDTSNVEFHVGTLERFERAPGSLDVICAYSILHLVEDRSSTLQRLFELLQPGGVLVSSTVCLGNSWVPYRPILAAMSWVGKAPSVQIMSTEALRTDLMSAGFVDIERKDVGAETVVAFFVAKKPS